MGRMIDILRTADRRPTGGDSTPNSPSVIDRGPNIGEQETVPMTLAANHPINEPALEDDNDVPFIEVGGPREPTLRLMAAPSSNNEISESGPVLLPSPGFAGEGSGVRVLEQAPSPPTPLPQSRERGEIGTPALFTIRFQPVHAARLVGRGPVAELIAFHQPDHTISVQYRSLAAEIARQLPGTSPRVLLFTGAAGGIGTTTVVLNLAMTLARQEAKVTVVDANLIRPAVTARLGMPEGPGLREVLAGQMPADWCLQESAHPNLFVLPAGSVGHPRDAVDHAAILDLLRDRGDCVLIDAGTWNDASPAADLACGSDAVYLVLGHDTATSSATAALQEEILTRTGRLRGCVLTQK